MEKSILKTTILAVGMLLFGISIPNVNATSFSSDTAQVQQGTVYLGMLGDMAESCTTHIMLGDIEIQEKCIDMIKDFNTLMSEWQTEHQQDLSDILFSSVLPDPSIVDPFAPDTEIQ